MSDYGKRDKRISFMDTDKRSADLMIRLKHDGLTKTKFFRELLTGYLDRDHTIVDFIERMKESSGLQSKKQSRIVEDAEEKGRENKRKFGLDDKEIENIFDILEKELPDL
jgi:glycerol-3-phosphate responsive antiterminator|tara:strand:+ start:3908 stop:4237 length:330 start_codon:yes stop_codon:yes gene_type:complete